MDRNEVQWLNKPNVFLLTLLWHVHVLTLSKIIWRRLNMTQYRGDTYRPTVFSHVYRTPLEHSDTSKEHHPHLLPLARILFTPGSGTGCHGFSDDVLCQQIAKLGRSWDCKYMSYLHHSIIIKINQYLYIYICMWKYICAYVNICTYIKMYIYIYMYIYICVCMYVCR